MAQSDFFAPAAKSKTYAPQVQVVKKSQQECEDFWAKLVRESEQTVFAVGVESSAPLSQAMPSQTAPLAQAASSSQAEPSSQASAPSASLSFEEQYEKLMGVVSNKPSHREMLVRALSFCEQEREFSVVEDEIQTYPEYPSAGQNPYRLITYLIDGGGLSCVEVDFDGNEITPDQKMGLSEDEVDDMIDCFHLRTTEVGRQLADDLAPQRRLSDLFRMFADRKPYYTELLDFCREPRKFKDIEKLFAGRDLSGLRTLHPESRLAIKPTVFVDNMEKAGAIVWEKDGWVLTKEGEAYLEAVMSNAAP